MIINCICTEEDVKFWGVVLVTLRGMVYLMLGFLAYWFVQLVYWLWVLWGM